MLPRAGLRLNLCFCDECVHRGRCYSWQPFSLLLRVTEISLPPDPPFEGSVSPQSIKGTALHQQEVRQGQGESLGSNGRWANLRAVAC